LTWTMESDIAPSVCFVEADASFHQFLISQQHMSHIATFAQCINRWMLTKNKMMPGRQFE